MQRRELVLLAKMLIFSNLELGLVIRTNFTGKCRFLILLGLARHQRVESAFEGKCALRVASDSAIGFKDTLVCSSLALASRIDFRLEVCKGTPTLKWGLRGKWTKGLLVAAVTIRRTKL